MAKSLVRNEFFAYKLEGLEELDNLLKQLPQAMEKAVLRAALKKAVKPIQVEARNNIPSRLVFLKESIQISTTLNKNQRRGRSKHRGEVAVYVGSTSAVAHLYEWGTAERFRKGSRGATGKIEALPFMTPAWDRKKDEALAILGTEIWNQLVKKARSLRKRAEKGTLSKRAVKELL